MANPLDIACTTCLEQLASPEGWESPTNCPNSKRKCKHHCNCIWTQDACCWCPARINKDGELRIG